MATVSRTAGVDKIAKYEILGKIGEGAMGVVYRARDPLIDRIVAIKTMSEDLDADATMRERFLREARSAGKLSHKNIITIYDLGEDAGRAYMVMEFLDGEDLGRRLKKPMTLEEKVSIMMEICQGIAHAHSHGVVHRDIKPGNIFITRSGTVKILDFGLARVATSEMTRVGTVMGTPSYMSPEQVRGNRVDHRSDIFSIGAVFYELLSGRRPFRAPSLPATFFRILSEDPEPIDPTGESVPKELCAVVSGALEKDPSRRFQTVDEMIEALGRVLHSGAPLTVVSELAATRTAQRFEPGTIRTVQVKSLQENAARERRAEQQRLEAERVEEERRRREKEEAERARQARLAELMARAEATRRGGDVEAAAAVAAEILALAPGDSAARELQEWARSESAIRAERERQRVEANKASELAMALAGRGDFQAGVFMLESLPRQTRKFAAVAEALDHCRTGVRRQREEAERREVEARLEATIQSRHPEMVAVLEPAPVVSTAPVAVLPAMPPSAPAPVQARGLSKVMLAAVAASVLALITIALIVGWSSRRVEEPKAVAQQPAPLATPTQDSPVGQPQSGQGTSKPSAPLGQQPAAGAARQLESAGSPAEASRGPAAKPVPHPAESPPSPSPASPVGGQRAEDTSRTATEKQAPSVVDTTHTTSPTQKILISVEPVHESLPPSLPEPPPRVAEPVKPVPDVAAEREAVKDTLRRYAQAIRDKDMAALRSVWPSLNAIDERKISDSFSFTQSHTVLITATEIQLKGSTAIARCTRQDDLVTNDRQKLSHTSAVVFVLRKSGSAWLIESIGQ